MQVSLSLLRAFEAASRTGSFQDAAVELHLSPSAVSHAIRKLEQTLGVTLFERDGRSVRLSSDGTALMRHVGPAFDDIRRGVDFVSARGPKLLRVHSAPSFAAQWLTPRLPRFLSANPDIEIRLSADVNYTRFTTDEFDVDIVYLTRHPIPQSLSCIRNSWTLTVDAYLRDPEFCERFLSADAVALAHDTMRGDDELRKFIVNWALENAAPAQQLAEHPGWTHVRYEECVAQPEATLELLAERLDLTDLDRMRAVLSRPSQSSRISTAQTRELIKAGAGARTVEAWRVRVDPDVESWCNRTLETFAIDPRVTNGV